jgi:hypothetical protein
MARKTDKAYDKALSRQTRQAAERFQRPDWGQEDERSRTAYDRLLEQGGTPVRKGGRR